MADIVIINPRFEPSYWGMEHALPFMGKRANLPVACLPLLAALTPAGHTVTLMDENVEAINYERCARADIVGVTGMSVQRFRMREILTELKARGLFTIVGGPWISVQEDYFGDLADVIFVGEAEETWPQFLQDWQGGQHRSRYEQASKSDMTKVPTPRFDLLKMQHYLFGSVQFSRGCPFQCEFCDIINKGIGGRTMRAKTPAQFVAELEALWRSGWRGSVFIADDNFIGDRKLVRELLPHVADWMKRRGYPFTLATEASINLALDAKLMTQMAGAGITRLFVGIESVDAEALEITRKRQNFGLPTDEACRRLAIAGIEVHAALILGFDGRRHYGTDWPRKIGSCPESRCRGEAISSRRARSRRFFARRWPSTRARSRRNGYWSAAGGSILIWLAAPGGNPARLWVNCAPSCMSAGATA